MKKRKFRLFICISISHSLHACMCIACTPLGPWTLRVFVFQLKTKNAYCKSELKHDKKKQSQLYTPASRLIASIFFLSLCFQPTESRTENKYLHAHSQCSFRGGTSRMWCLETVFCFVSTNSQNAWFWRAFAVEREIERLQ